ncbi:MAG TPA: circularly permuted type 2 ATP-grasp protein, partial [Humisphaera sp.]
MTLTADTLTPAAPPPAPLGFADGYEPRVPALDEMVEPDGSLRPHWRMFVSMLDDLGREELGRRWEQARRQIRENGITHNVYGDPNGLDRPWSLDLVPLLMPADQWRGLEAGLAQRARLLDRLAVDLYGPGEAVASGLLPAELLYANPGYLRPLHGVRPPGDRWLHLYAADVVRAADGTFRVLADRTQAPSGAGYTLENRIVLSRALPTAFRQCNVQRLAPFFITLRQTLAALAPGNRENPRVVLLTPGPYNETYFEHAYLARYLGYALVQGNDLTVRDGRVFLKTLGGLQRVDVILRRVDDEYCDPLELYGNSFLGVPGLVEAIRQGTVAVANALGAGLLQAPALMGFLPGLCRHFLGEDLLLPSAPTWWCGDDESLRYVLANLAHLVIKPAFPTRGSDPEFGTGKTAAGLEELAARIRARPEQWIAQEQVETHTAPVLLNDRVQSRRFVVRSYLVSNAAGSYDVMPGGLTRVTGAGDDLVVSLQKGGGSKDTWVLSDGPVADVTLLTAASQPVELSRGGGDLPSRVADDLFWLGRYVQRAEGTVRLTRSIFGRLMDPSIIESPRTVEVLVRALLGKSPARFGKTAAAAAAAVAAAADPAARPERELVADVFNPADRGGLRATIRHVHALARVLRDRISADAYRILQTIERDVADFNVNVDDDQVPTVLELLNKLMVGFLAFAGVAADSMTRGQSWRFLDMGFRLERASAVTKLLRLTLVDASVEEGSLLDGVLEVGDSSLTYRRRYLTQLEAPAVVDLLLADETNPRSVAFQVAALQDHLQG